MHESQDIEYSCNVVMYRIHKHVMGHFYYSKFVRFQRQTEWFILFYGLFFYEMNVKLSFASTRFQVDITIGRIKIDFKDIFSA